MQIGPNERVKSRGFQRDDFLSPCRVGEMLKQMDRGECEGQEDLLTELLSELDLLKGHVGSLLQASTRSRSSQPTAAMEPLLAQQRLPDDQAGLACRAAVEEEQPVPDYQVFEAVVQQAVDTGERRTELFEPDACRLPNSLFSELKQALDGKAKEHRVRVQQATGRTDETDEER